MNEIKKKILIVEDEPKIVEAVVAYLEKSGYNPFVAYDGEKALSLFNNINPDLIVLDLMLPKISGEEICKTIRKKSRVPIIMLTAKISEEE
ncbi:DNA-binding response regulator MtrA [bioreactor metagenome]|uniref:DNA-binding response regulator MtrA n=1 Tax=bioreactor metagenome TaxID=1076179 RepID=A0A645GCM7_9ZZZZ